MITVGIHQAKASLGQLAQSAANGEVVVLTKRGKPVAEIRAPQSEVHQENLAEVIADIRKFRRGQPAGRFDLAELVAEGRR